MTVDHALKVLSHQEHAALMNAAKQRAGELRDQAIREFWAAMDRRALAVWHAMRWRRAWLRAREPAATRSAAGFPPPSRSSCSVLAR